MPLNDGSSSGLKLRIEQAGAELLQRPARPVEPDELRSAELQQLIDLMFNTLQGIGVGLAAPQVGIGLQLVVIEDPASLQAQVPPELLREQERVPIAPHVLVNPRLVIEDDADLATFFEGCLSVDGYRALVPRARQVRVQALDRFGAAFERQASGWYARILQHELDHLAGRLYLERMLPSSFISTAAYAQHWSSLPIAEARRRLTRPASGHSPSGPASPSAGS